MKTNIESMMTVFENETQAKQALAIVLRTNLKTKKERYQALHDEMGLSIAEIIKVMDLPQNGYGQVWVAIHRRAQTERPQQLTMMQKVERLGIPIMESSIQDDWVNEWKEIIDMLAAGVDKNIIAQKNYTNLVTVNKIADRIKTINWLIKKIG